jgi:hypothetical protein
VEHSKCNTTSDKILDSIKREKTEKKKETTKRRALPRRVPFSPLLYLTSSPMDVRLHDEGNLPGFQVLSHSFRSLKSRNVKY